MTTTARTVLLQGMYLVMQLTFALWLWAELGRECVFGFSVGMLFAPHRAEFTAQLQRIAARGAADGRTGPQPRLPDPGRKERR